MVYLEQHLLKQYNIVIGRERCDRKASIRYVFDDMISFALMANNGDPFYFQKAIHNDDKQRYESMCIDKTQELVKLPKKMFTSCKRVYKMKDEVLEKKQIYVLQYEKFKKSNREDCVHGLKKFKSVSHYLFY